jgi:Etoposide-induced protein 2.4 (EI24)
MNLLFDSFWRAVVYCLHPRVIFLSLLPLGVLTLLGLALGYFFWGETVNAVRLWLENSGLFGPLLDWFTRLGLQPLRTAAAPLVVIAIATPVLIVLVLLLVAVAMTPALVTYVSKRRFSTLERRGDGALWRSLLWSVSTSVVALVLLLISLPLWLVPPLIMILPPLIWGWLTYRVMAFDALAAHASPQERKLLFTRHRFGLMGMGVMAGCLGASPSLIWSVGIWTIVWAPFLVLMSIWLYTLVFTFCSLWFSHYCLHALQQLRLEQATAGKTAIATNTTAVELP